MTGKAYGNVFREKNKKNEKGPDWAGTFKLDRGMVEEIAQAPRNGEGQVEVRLAGWWKEGPQSGEYISANLQLSRPRQDQGQGYARQRDDDRGRDDQRGPPRDDRSRDDDRRGPPRRDDRDQYRRDPKSDSQQGFGDLPDDSDIPF